MYGDAVGGSIVRSITTGEAVAVRAMLIADVTIAVSFLPEPCPSTCLRRKDDVGALMHFYQEL
jgi:hypothetical protein